MGAKAGCWQESSNSSKLNGLPKGFAPTQAPPRMPDSAVYPCPSDAQGVTLEAVQSRIRDLFGSKDAKRGIDGTFLWFMEEVGELASGLRGQDDTTKVATEFADVLAWLATLANIRGIDLSKAFRDKYGLGCPGCGKTPCGCPPQEKP